MKVTAETLTDEQIDRLLVSYGSMSVDCRLARCGAPKATPQRVIWSDARERIAAAINARAVKEAP